MAKKKTETASKESTAKEASSPKKGGGKKKEVKAPAASKRDYSLAKDLPKRLQPETERRKVKPITRLTEEAESPSKEEKPLVIKKGKGSKLEDIPSINAHINRRTNSDDLLRFIHGILYGGRVSKKTSVKDNLKDFSGIVYEDDKGREKLENRLNTHHLKYLRDMAALFGLDPEGEREEVSKRLADWLEKPKDTGETYQVGPKPKKRKRSASRSRSTERSKSPAKKKGKKKEKDPNAPKRALSAYMFFVKDKRPEIAKKYPNEKVTEIATRLGAKWSKMTAKEKKPYEDKAAKDKERYAKEMKKSGKKK